jgi:hypothetical protein
MAEKSDQIPSAVPALNEAKATEASSSSVRNILNKHLCNTKQKNIL